MQEWIKVKYSRWQIIADIDNTIAKKRRGSHMSASVFLAFDNLDFTINMVAQQNTIWNNNNLTKLNYLSNIQLGRL